MNIRHFFVEAVRSIRANAAISFAATVAALLALFLLGAFIPTYLVVQKEVDAQKANLFVNAYVRDSATIAQLNDLGTKIQSTPHVKSFRLISKEEALARFKERYGTDPTESLGANPLPRTFEITPDDANNAKQIAAAIEGDKALLLDSVTPTGVEYGGADAETFLSVAKFIKWGGLGLVLVLIVASMLLIANTIRLSIFARRREVEVMKLVGATNWFIRWPFMIEGVICGVAGAILAFILLVGVKLSVVDKLIELTTVSDGPLGSSSSNSNLRDAVSAGSLGWLAVVLVAVGAVVGAVGSGVTLRRFLRV